MQEQDLQTGPRHSRVLPGRACTFPEPRPPPPRPVPTWSPSLTDPESARGAAPAQGAPDEVVGVRPLKTGSGVCEDGLQVVKFSFTKKEKNVSSQENTQLEDKRRGRRYELPLTLISRIKEHSHSVS